MPLFPVSVPSFPLFPSFPSVSSMRALLDPEPQLFYPAPKSPTRRRRRDSSSSTRSIASGVGGNDDYNTGGSGSPVRCPPPSGLAGLGRLNAASRSAVDVSGWGKVDNPLAELGRRNSLSSRPIYVDGLRFQLPATPPRRSADLVRCPSVTETSPSPSPRRSHRRSQSAMPTPGYTRPLFQAPAPRGRLVEFCRNPLASSSAVSLPTLAEGEMESLHTPPPVPESGEHTPRLYRRPSTRKTIVIPSSAPTSPTSTSSLVGSFPSPLSLSFSLDSASSHASLSEDSDYFGPQPPTPEIEDQEETPRPASKRQNSDLIVIVSPTLSSSVPPPQRVAKLRPPPSSQSCSSYAVPSQRSRTQSYGPVLSFSNSRSISSVSDVAVMATWSFPPSPERQGQRTPQVDVAAPSGRLRERLRTLSMLDTASPKDDLSAGSPCSEVGDSSERLSLRYSSSAENAQHHPRCHPDQGWMAPPLSLLQRGRPSSHRHTHSSPTSLTPPRPTSSGTALQSNRVNRTGTGLLFTGLTTEAGGNELGLSSRNLSARSGRPSHRRTTTPSRLRSPQLLSLPLEEGLVVSQLRAGARSRPQAQSPEDRTDIGRKCASGVTLRVQEPEVQQYPLTRARSAVDRSTSEAERSRGWWRMRRYSMSGEVLSSLGQTEVAGNASGSGTTINAAGPKGRDERRERGTSPEDERFIDFADI